MAISAIAGIASALSAAVTIGFSAITFGQVAAAFAIGAGLSMVSRALAPKPNIGAQMRGINQTTREPASSRKIIYGRMRVGGQVVFISHSGEDNKYLHLAIAFASHEIQAYDEIWFNDNRIWTASNGFQGDWGTYVTIDRKFGTAGQSASTDLVNANSRWTTDHKLSGIAYIAFRLEWDQDKFPQGVPNITATIRGKKVYDPRTQTIAYSQNPALCVRDYMISEYGLDEVAANINDTSVSDAADLCDESVSLDGGGTQDRYQCNGVIDTANQIKANIEQLLSSMGGRLTYSGGEYFIDGAEYKTPSHTFTEADVISDIQTQTKQSRRGIYNGVKGIFVSEEKNYKVLDYPAQISSTYEAEDGDPIYLDMPLPCVTNNTQAQRLAKIALLKSRQQVVMTLTVNLKGLNVKVGDTIQVTNDRLNYSSKVFEVIDYSLAITDGALGVNLSCIETGSAIYDWTTSDEADFLSGGELPLYDGRTVDNVTSLTMTEIGLRGPDGGVKSAVELSWTAPTDAFIEFYTVRYNKTGTTDYFEVQTRETNALLEGLDISSNYDFRVKAQNLIGVRSSGTSLTNQSLNGDTTAPSAPTSGAATGGIQTITAEWSNPTDIDFKHVEVFVNTTDSIPATPTAVVDGEEYIVTGLSGAATRYFWLKSVDFSGNKSAATASFSGTSVVASSSDIGTGAVGSGNIADGAVGTNQIATGAITTTTIADDAITTPKIATNAVTANEIAANTITASQIASNTITASEIATDTITASEIAAGAIDTTELAADAVTTAKIAANAVTATEINVTSLDDISADAGTITGGSVGGISITSTKLYAGTGDWANTNTGFYVDNTGKFSLKDKFFYNPTNNLLTVDGNITADVITAKENLVVLGDLEASSMAAGSITRAMFSQDALDEIYGALATSVGGSNGDYKEASGSFTTSGGTVTVGTSSDKFDHGTSDVVVEFLANHYFYTTTNYTTAQAQATLNFEVSADGTFTDLTSATKTQTLQFVEYDLTSYYGYTYLVYYFNGEHSKTFTTGSGNDIPDSTELQFRVRVTGVGTAFTSQTVPFTVEANEGVTGVVSTGGNADTLDNLDSTKFLRSDVDDTFDANLTITGNLTVNGTQTTLNTATLQVEDKNIVLNYGTGDTSGSANGAGITIQDAVNSSTDATLTWDATNDKFDFSHDVTAPNLNISNWNTAYGWGDHSTQGYLTSYTETDTLDSVTDRGATTTNNISVGTIDSGKITAPNIDLEETSSSTAEIRFIDTDAAVNFALRLNGEGLDFYEPEEANRLHVRIIDDGGLNAVYGLRTGSGDGTTRIDGSGNATFGTITHTGDYKQQLGANSAPSSTDVFYIGGDNLASADASMYLGNRGDGTGYGWRLYYHGTGSGNLNDLSIQSENLGSPINALRFNQDGAATFAKSIKVGAGTQAGNSDAPITIRTGNAFAGFDFHSTRTAGNIGGLRWYSTSSTTVAEAQLLVEVDGTMRFYNGTNGAQNVFTISNNGALTTSGSITSGGIVSGTAFVGGLYGGATGAPDARIWAVSADYPNYGIFYDEGSPDYINFRWNGVDKLKINLENGLVNSVTGYQLNGQTVINSSRGGVFSSDTSITGGRLTITDDTDALRLRSTTNGVGVNINFSDLSNGGYAQQGNLNYVHQDGSSYGSGNAFIFSSTEATLTVLADGKLMFKEGLYLKPASGTGGGTQIIDGSRNLKNIPQAQFTGANPLQFFGVGSSTYTLGTMYCQTSEFAFEAPLTTNSVSGAKVPIILTWRGGYGTQGGIKITGGQTEVSGSFKSSNATMYKAGTNNVQTQVLCLGSNSTRPVLQFSEGTGTSLTDGMSLEYNGQGSGDGNFMTFNSVAGSSVFRVYSSGDTEIYGNLEVTEDLNVSGDIVMSGANNFLVIENSQENNAGILFNDLQAGAYPAASSQRFAIQYHCGNETLIMGHDDDSYAGFNFGKGGSLVCSGNVTAFSDERLKEDIETLNGSKVYEMRGVSFTKDGKAGSGVVAQELEQVAPELVHDGEYKSVAYGNLVGYLIEAVKDQKAIIENLTQRIEELENGND